MPPLDPLPALGQVSTSQVNALEGEDCHFVRMMRTTKTASQASGLGTPLATASASPTSGLSTSKARQNSRSTPSDDQSESGRLLSRMCRV